MPIYQYKCKKCGHTMEFLEKSAAGHKHVCEQCESSYLQKLLSAFAVGRSGSIGQLLLGHFVVFEPKSPNPVFDGSTLLTSSCSHKIRLM